MKTKILLFACLIFMSFTSCSTEQNDDFINTAQREQMEQWEIDIVSELNLLYESIRGIPEHDPVNEATPDGTVMCSWDTKFYGSTVVFKAVFFKDGKWNIGYIKCSFNDKKEAVVSYTVVASGGSYVANAACAAHT